MTGVLIDTSVWSLALRKKRRTAEEEKRIGRLSELLRELRMVIIGPIWQELLSGISEPSRYDDFLICAVAGSNGLAILTLDQDFKRYQEFIGIALKENFSA